MTAEAMNNASLMLKISANLEILAMKTHVLTTPFILYLSHCFVLFHFFAEQYSHHDSASPLVLRTVMPQ